MTTWPASATRASDLASCVIAAIALPAILVLHLLPALLAGLLVYELIHFLAPRLRIMRIRRRPGKLVAVGVLAAGIIGVLGLVGWGIVAFVRSETGSVPALLQMMADVIDSWRTKLPATLTSQLPGDVDQLEHVVVAWLRDHAGTVQNVGKEAGRVLAHILVGTGIGALVSLHEVSAHDDRGPLARALQERAVRLSDAFRRVVFGQIRISAINAVLTGLYLTVALPLFGAHVPLRKTMIAVTFVVGLLPVVGNLISNTVIVVLSLSVSVPVAFASLVFLVVIHKLEYFLNAHIVGAQVRAHAWELLLAMLVMEAAFGMAGLVAAPIYYAYLKNELVSRKVI